MIVYPYVKPRAYAFAVQPTPEQRAAPPLELDDTGENVVIGDMAIKKYNERFPHFNNPRHQRALDVDDNLRATVGDTNIAIQDFYDTIPTIPGLPATLGGIPTMLVLGGGALGLILLIVLLKKR